nr:hypothetical protein [Lachnospiraceae bacterium]
FYVDLCDEDRRTVPGVLTPEISLSVNLKIEVGAVKVCMRCIKYSAKSQRRELAICHRIIDIFDR